MYIICPQFMIKPLDLFKELNIIQLFYIITTPKKWKLHT